MNDPVRAKLLRALADAGYRIDAATNGILRVLHGHGWNDSQVKAHRVVQDMAVTDLDAITRTLTMLDKIDAETKK